MRRAVFLIGLALLAGCQTINGSTGIRFDRDLYGRVYPEKCQTDLGPLRRFMEARGQLVVKYVPRSEMNTLPNGEKNDASVRFFGRGAPVIRIADDMTELHTLDSRQHEMVHIHCRPWDHD